MTLNLAARKMFSVLGLAVLASSILLPTVAKADMSPEVKAKVEKYKKLIVKWAEDPTIVSYVKEANTKGPMPGMSNAKWVDLDDKDPIVLGMQNNPAGKVTKKLEAADSNVNKVTVWDEKGNMIASSTKTLIYNAASRPAFTGAMKGTAWAAPGAKPDPTTQKKSVNISAPVMDGGKIIGVMNAAITVE